MRAAQFCGFVLLVTGKLLLVAAASLSLHFADISLDTHTQRANINQNGTGGGDVLCGPHVTCT